MAEGSTQTPEEMTKELAAKTAQMDALEKEVSTLKKNLKCAMNAARDGTEPFKKGEANFAFLVLQEHPYGREMLKQLLAAGHKPRIVIEENDGVEAPKERTKFEKRIEGHPLAATIEEQCKANSIEHVTVPQHNFSPSLIHLERVKPRLLVLGGTRIIR